MGSRINKFEFENILYPTMLNFWSDKQVNLAQVCSGSFSGTKPSGHFTEKFMLNIIKMYDFFCTIWNSKFSVENYVLVVNCTL